MNRSILFAALLISGAILANGYLDRASRPSHIARPSTSVVKKAVVEGFNKKNDVRDCHIDDIRYSEGDRQMLVQVSVAYADGVGMSAGIGLNRDEFGVYHGECDLGGKKAIFEIK